MYSILILIDNILGIYMWCIIIVAVMSWLTYAGIINTHNRFVSMVGNFLYRITDPVLGSLRRWVPNIGGIDISPVIVILLIVFLRNLLHEYGGTF